MLMLSLWGYFIATTHATKSQVLSAYIIIRLLVLSIVSTDVVMLWKSDINSFAGFWQLIRYDITVLDFVFPEPLAEGYTKSKSIISYRITFQKPA